MKTIYFNMKTKKGVKTLDQLTQGKNSPTDLIDFYRAVRFTIRFHRLGGLNVYASQKCAKDWRPCPCHQ